MADYATARAALVTIMGGVSISSPVSASLANNVYATKPDAQDIDRYPSVMIIGYTSRWLRGMGKRERQYAVQIQLAVKALEGATAHAQLDALKEALGVAFDAKTTLGLGGGYHVVEGPNWLLREPVEDGGVTWDEGEILISIKDAVSFGP